MGKREELDLDVLESCERVAEGDHVRGYVSVKLSKYCDH